MSIRYIPFLGGAFGGGGPPGGFTWYYGLYEAGGVMSSGNAATDARDDFVAALTVGVEFEDFEGNAPGGDPWESSASLLATSITKNGVAMTFENDATTATDNNGRFSTSDSTALVLFAEASLLNDGVTDTFVRLTFSPPVAFFGCYLTDVGDFSSGDIVYIEVDRTGGGMETHNITDAEYANGNLVFIGFTDTGGDTYDEVRIRVHQWSGGGAAETDGIGIDDIYWGEQADLA